MSNHSVHDGDSARPLRPIRLIRQDAQFLVQPPHGTEQFVLPSLPLSICNRCLACSETFWHRHHRCMGFVLMFDLGVREWAFGIPTQRCSVDSTCWDVRPEEFRGLTSDYLLAGSFQSRIVQSYEELPDVPPPSEGLHVVSRIQRDGLYVHAFVRAGLELVRLHLRQVTVDDWAATLIDAKDRLLLV